MLKDGTIVPEQLPANPGQMPEYVQARALSNAWHCQQGHILGVVIREKVHEHTLPRLMLFRGALEPNEPANHAVPFAKMDGGEVVCGICGERKVWHPGDDFIESLKGKPKATPVGAETEAAWYRRLNKFQNEVLRHIELLAAAYCKATDIPPEECVLVVEQRIDQMVYRFEKKTPKPKDK